MISYSMARANDIITSSIGPAAKHLLNQFVQNSKMRPDFKVKVGCHRFVIFIKV